MLVFPSVIVFRTSARFIKNQNDDANMLHVRHFCNIPKLCGSPAVDFRWQTSYFSSTDQRGFYIGKISNRIDWLQLGNIFFFSYRLTLISKILIKFVRFVWKKSTIFFKLSKRCERSVSSRWHCWRPIMKSRRTLNGLFFKKLI